MKTTPPLSACQLGDRPVSIRASTDTKAMIEEFRRAQIWYYQQIGEADSFAAATAKMSEDLLIRIALKTAINAWTKTTALKSPEAKIQ